MKHLLIILLLSAAAVFAQEDKCIAILKSDAPLNEKAAACRELARVGTKLAVPVLAPLLADEKLSHMAQYALEPIPDPSVDAALRDALGKLKGRPLVGVIGCLGARKDATAIKPLAKYLTDDDPAVVQAAAGALGKIGGAAATALQSALSTSSPANRLAVCEGLFRCAEAMSGPAATAIYDKVRALPNLPHQVRVAALKGAIQSRGAKGVPLLIETIRAESYVLAAEATRLSMDIPGAELTQAIAREFAQANEEKRLLLIQTLGHRGDSTAAPALTPLAQSGSTNLRIAAIRSLVQLGNLSSLPVLVALVKDPEPTISRAAQTGLIGFPAKEADAALVAMLSESDPRIRVAFIEAVGQRRITAAAAALGKAAADADAGVAVASFKALGEIAGVAEIPGVVDAMLQARAVAAAETALTAICARQTDPKICTDKLLPGLMKAQGEPKLALLRVLRTVGDPQALAAMRAAARESDLSVKDTALRALCDWPNADALPDLAQIAKTAADKKFKILALRGQLRLIPMQTVADAQKLSQLKEILPLIERIEEKRLALAILGNLPIADALAVVVPYLTDEGLKEEASGAAVQIAEKIVDRHPAEVAKAMKQVQTSNNKLAQRAQQLLARVPTSTK
jgi:HEAT repeat protein